MIGDRILVIGAGVSGLTTAKCLIDAGFKVTVVADKKAELTPSVVAGALWEWPPAVCGHHTAVNSLRRSKPWSATSYQRFKTLSKIPETGVSMAPAVFYFRQRIEDCPLEQKKMEETAAQVEGFERTSDLIERHGVNRSFGVCDAYTYLAPLIETDIYMQWLRQTLVDAGCEFEQTKITRPLTEVTALLCTQYDAIAIVNCSGLGAGDLAKDSMQPLRGALIRVRNDGSSMPQITTAHCLANDDSNPHQQMIYIIPRGPNYLLLGGTAELGEWETNIGLDNYQPVRDMWQRCQEFLPSLRSAVIDSDQPERIGLRPHRKENVRLERDPDCPVVHNYGHGGSGFTFSWGCSEEVVSLIQAMNHADLTLPS